MLNALRPLALLALLGGAVGAFAPAQAQTPLGYGVLHAFSATDSSGRNGDGTTPYAALTPGGDGYLYGVGFRGGSSGNGAIFKLRLDGSGFQTLYSFSAISGSSPYNNKDGRSPLGALLPGGDGFFYGTAEAGGAYGNGSLFKIRPDGSGFAVIHSFSATDNSGDNTDGRAPFNGLTAGGDGFFYGVTRSGGTYGYGTVFQVNNDGSIFNTIHTFSASSATAPYGNADGQYPNGGLATNGDGFLYGTAAFGGANADGVVFRLRLDGSSFLALHSFTALSAAPPYGNADGAYPRGGLAVGPGGSLYGTTYAGGPNSAGGLNSAGVVFKVQPNGSGFTAIHSFSALSDTTPYGNADGANPNYSGITPGADGLLYGTAASGGGNNQGTVFRLAPDGSGFQTLHSFSASSATSPYGNLDGTSPEGSLAFAPDGFLYGTALNGGANNNGVLFRIAPTHAHLLWDNADGRASVWSIDFAGNIAVSPTYGPFTGWQAVGLSTGADGLSHLLWSHPSDGQASLWDLNAAGTPVNQYTYGPYNGWGVQAITTGTGNADQLLWNDSQPLAFGSPSNGPLALWNVAAGGRFTYNLYGPYAGWYGQALASSSDGGFTHILWDNTSGQANLWAIGPMNNGLISPVFGPFPGWKATSLGVGLQGVRDLLWTHPSDGEASLWRVDAAGNPATAVFGPYSGYQAIGAAAGPDGAARLLWDKSDGTAALWLVNPDNTFSSVQYGPVPGWQAVAVSAGP